MRILLITSEEWNDFVYPNGILTNWFSNFNVDVAQIYTSPGLPINNICDYYFQITDSQMAKSILGGPKAGRVVYKKTDKDFISNAKENAQRKGVYGFFKKLSLWWRTPIMLVKDLIWDMGRYDKEELQLFVKKFNPDIVFCPRYVSKGLMRLEKVVSTMTTAPFVAFTADDEISLENVKWWQLAYYRRLSAKYRFKKHVRLYSHYFTFSQDQADEYKAEYNISTSTIFKSGDFSSAIDNKTVCSPIRLVYAGHLYCNRWKSLEEIGKALNKINDTSVKMILEVYTQDELTAQQKRALCEDRYIFYKGSVTPDQLVNIYKKSDIALHVESFDEKYKKKTRVSFSTKIIDLMASGCAILAICWDKHAGYQYLKSNDAAFCCPNYQSIYPTLKSICDTPHLIIDYQKKAFNCGKNNHSRDVIHKRMLDVFETAIKNNKRL